MKRIFLRKKKNGVEGQGGRKGHKMKVVNLGEKSRSFRGIAGHHGSRFTKRHKRGGSSVVAKRGNGEASSGIKEKTANYTVYRKLNYSEKGTPT